MLSDEQLKCWATSDDLMLRAVARELLAIRERAGEFGLDDGVTAEMVRYVAYGEGAPESPKAEPKPGPGVEDYRRFLEQVQRGQRLYSEDAVERAMLSVWGEHSVRAVMRSLRGEGEVRSVIRRDAGPGGCPELCSADECRKAGRCEG